MNEKNDVLECLKVFRLSNGGIGNWLSENTDDEILDRLTNVSQQPLSKAQLNQLLTLGHAAPVSDGFFKFYWLHIPKWHPYDVKKLPKYQKMSRDLDSIKSLDHLSWGLYRLYTDGLLWFGNIRAAYRELRTKNFKYLKQFFSEKRFDTDAIKCRGSALYLFPIAKDNRFLISEMACKTYGDDPNSSEFKEFLFDSYKFLSENGKRPVLIRDLLEQNDPQIYTSQQQEFKFTMDEVLDETVESEEELNEKYESIAKRFFNARESALNNTRLYLSMVGELDVYVATSMRNRDDFRNMANKCEEIFNSEKLKPYKLRYFDPTLSAAKGHEDKGLIECLMVKCAKVLVYCAGKNESFGKDAEAAMALSLGKPVIFLCDEEQKKRFYKDVHPLSRLIEFGTGVAVGAMVTDSTKTVSNLLYRILENKMEYELEQSKPDYLHLREKLTDSVVRLQTNDEMLTETFWNYYHNK